MSVDSVLVVLPAGLKKVDGVWMSTDLTAEDSHFGAPGGLLRMHAAALYALQHPNITIFTGGSYGYDVGSGGVEDRPLLADVVERELLALGVPQKRIILERSSNSTFQELEQIERFCMEESPGQIAILTNRWHIPRLTAIIEYKFLSLKKKGVLLIAAEDVLLEYAPNAWASRIKNGYQSPFMIELMAKERRGVEQIKAGTYSFR